MKKLEKFNKKLVDDINNVIFDVSNEIKETFLHIDYDKILNYNDYCSEKLLLREEKLERILNENKMKKFTFKELWNRLPESVRIATSKCEQNPAYHPEGNVDVHIEMVFDYANDNYFGDNDLLLCALFHDLGKVDTFKIHPKKGVPTSYGHERHAEKYIDKYIHLFADLRPNIERIKEICANHMKAHLYISGSLSKPAKRKAFESLKYFNDIMKFAKCDDGGKKKHYGLVDDL